MFLQENEKNAKENAVRMKAEEEAAAKLWAEQQDAEANKSTKLNVKFNMCYRM